MKKNAALSCLSWCFEPTLGADALEISPVRESLENHILTANNYAKRTI